MVKLVLFVITFFCLINKCVIWGRGGGGGWDRGGIKRAKQQKSYHACKFNF